MKRFLIAAAFALVSGPLSAATLFVDEFLDAPGGDFDNALATSNFNVGTMTAGFSEVLGELSGDCVNGNCNTNPSVGDTQDSFAFTIAAGFELLSLRFFSEGFPFEFDLGVAIDSFVGGWQNEAFAAFPVNTGGGVLTAPLSAGTYYISVFGGSSSVDGPFDAFYGLNFDVQPATAAAVPLPAGLILMLTGLGAIALPLRRRRPA